MFFWNSLAFSVIQQMLAIWSLVPLPFLNRVWTSGSSQFTLLLKPGLENFEHYFASVWDECNCAVVWTFFDVAFLWDWSENWPVQPCGHYWVFQICWHIECSTFTASSFRIWNKLKFYLKFNWNSLISTSFVCSDTSKARLTLHSRMSGSRWVITASWLSGSWRSFLYNSSVYSCHLFTSTKTSYCLWCMQVWEADSFKVCPCVDLKQIKYIKFKVGCMYLTL